MHCTRQYIVGRELMSRRAVVNLLDLLAASWDVAFSSVNSMSLMESALSVKFKVFQAINKSSLPVVAMKFVLEKRRRQES